MIPQIGRRGHLGSRVAGRVAEVKGKGDCTFGIPGFQGNRRSPVSACSNLPGYFLPRIARAELSVVIVVPDPEGAVRLEGHRVMPTLGYAPKSHP